MTEEQIKSKIEGVAIKHAGIKRKIKKNGEMEYRVIVDYTVISKPLRSYQEAKELMNEIIFFEGDKDE